MGLFDGIPVSLERVQEAQPRPLEAAERGARALDAGDTNARVREARQRRLMPPGTRRGDPTSRPGHGGSHGDAREPVEGSRELPEAIPLARASGGAQTPRGVDLLQISLRPPDFDESRQALFLELMCEVPSIELNAFRAGVMVSQVRHKRDSDPGFEEALQMAKAMAAGQVEEKAFRLAIQGVRKGVYFQGVRVDEEVQYLPDLMRTVMAANDPRYKQKVEMSGSVDVNHNWADMIKALKQSRAPE